VWVGDDACQTHSASRSEKCNKQEQDVHFLLVTKTS
jgi:hypothetical protein